MGTMSVIEEFRARLVLGEYEARKHQRAKLVQMMKGYRGEVAGGGKIKLFLDCSTGAP